MATFVPLVLFVLIWWWVAQRRWFARRRVVAVGSTTATSLIRGPSRNAGECARSLARVWSRDLARSPAFATGTALLLVIYVAFALAFGAERESWWLLFQVAPWFAHPLVGMTVVAVHRAVTRARRDEVSELADACPLSPSIRTAGHLGAVVVPLGVFAAFVVAFVATKEVRGVGAIGPVGSSWLDLVGAFVLIVGGVALGVALGRWSPFQLTPVIALLVILVMSLTLSTRGDPGWNPLAELSTVPPVEEIGELLAPRPNLWHVVWLLGLTGVTIAVALAWSRRDRAVGAMTVVAIATTIVGGIGATRSTSSSTADHIVELLVDPERHQHCESSASGALDVCVYDGFDEIAPLLMTADQVADAIPTGGPFVVRQGLVARHADELAPEVVEHLPEQLIRPPNEVVIRIDPPSDDAAARFPLAFLAAGLPTDEPADGVPLIVVGQARSVVALWLVTAGLSDDDAHQMLSTDSDHSAEPMARSAVWSGAACWIPPAVTSVEELAFARRLAVGDDTRTLGILAARWEHWIDPNTSTTELAAALGHELTSFTTIEPHHYDTGC